MGKKKKIYNEVKRFFRDFGDASSKGENFKIVKKLGAKDSVILSKILPNQLTNPNLLNDEYKIELSEDVWNAIKRAGYFNEGEAGSISREQFNDYLNTSKLKKIKSISLMLKKLDNKLDEEGLNYLLRTNEKYKELVKKLNQNYIINYILTTIHM